MAQPAKHPVTGIWQIRRKVPQDLRSALGVEYKRSLKTRDPVEAKGLFALAWSASEELFAHARAQTKGLNLISARDMRQLASRWVRAETVRMEQQGDFARWLDEVGTTEVYVDGDVSEVMAYRSLRDAMDDDPEYDPDASVRSAIAAALREANLPFPSDQSQGDQLAGVFRDYVIRLSDVALTRQQGDWTVRADLLNYEPLDVVAPVDGSRLPLKLMGLFKTYSQEKILNDGDTASVRRTLKAYKSIVEQFIEICGDLPVAKFERQAVHDFRSAIAQLPAKGEGIRGLTVRELIHKAESEKLPRVSTPTVRNKLRAVSAVFSHGVRMGELKENPIIASGVAKAAAKAASKDAGASRRRKDYTHEEIAAIFSSPIYSPGGWKSPRADFGEAMYWLPLILYYTGARREEIAQLRKEDVQYRLGVHFLSILDTPDAEDGDRSVKTEGSRRSIPLHADLVDRKLLDYVAALPDGSQLFPKLERSPSGRYGENFGKLWAKYLREVVGLTGKVRPSHGFRHTFKTFCREEGIPEDVSDAITGHAGVSVVARSYGSMPLTRKAQELAKFPSVKSHFPVTESKDDIQGL